MRFLFYYIPAVLIWLFTLNAGPNSVNSTFVFMTINECGYKVVASLFYYADNIEYRDPFPWIFYPKTYQTKWDSLRFFFKYLLSFFHNFVVVTLVETPYIEGYALHFSIGRVVLVTNHSSHNSDFVIWWCWCSETLSFLNIFEFSFSFDNIFKTHMLRQRIWHHTWIFLVLWDCICCVCNGSAIWI